MTTLYELTTYRHGGHGDKLGTFLFTATAGTEYRQVLAFCERFLAGVDSSLAELCTLTPAVLDGDTISDSHVAHLVASWPPVA
jgi:hypothetical protein